MDLAAFKKTLFIKIGSRPYLAHRLWFADPGSPRHLPPVPAAGLTLTCSLVPFIGSHRAGLLESPSTSLFQVFVLSGLLPGSETLFPEPRACLAPAGPAGVSPSVTSRRCSHTYRSQQVSPLHPQCYASSQWSIYSLSPLFGVCLSLWKASFNLIWLFPAASLFLKVYLFIYVCTESSRLHESFL